MDERELYKATQQRTLEGAYLLHGSEEFTKQQAIERIVNLLDISCRELNMETLKSPTAAQLLSACDQLPFFDDKRLVIVKDWSSEELERCLDKLPSLPPTTILLFVRRGEEKSTTLLYKRLNPLGRAVEFSKLTEDRAANMLLSEAALYGCELSTLTARQLVRMVGTDAYRLRNEFSKAADYVGRGNPITEHALKAAVTPASEYNIFNMLDQLLSSNKKSGLRLLKVMLQSGEKVLPLTSFLVGRIKLILHAKELLNAKTPQKEIISQLGGNPRAADIAIKSAKTQDEKKLRAALKALTEVDLQLKQGLMKDEDALMLAIYRCF